MANIEALKKSRKNERAAFRKAYNRVEELIELKVFKGKVDRLENTHSNILELLSEKDYDEEFEIVEDFRDKATRIQTKARRMINGQQNTLKIKIKVKNCSLIVRAMYDSGSQKSYIRKEMVSALGLAPLRQQHLPHALFGGERIKEKFYNVYNIELGSLDGSFNYNNFNKWIFID
ncbi:integrase catalytic domain-containing protein [Trichonephila clavata]|uniref:Integrase catalytic domain-containing protein n=1 Tax=Trichonephila clavata TaxID=2740835 RepID=A0A8X6LIZ5_TRICU|nr:integrase catalytic domain-containing protein [Trichonephila clavata]